MKKITFLFYDYETFGINPALDKPSQFACVRTDKNFNILEDMNCFYCYPPNDYLPNPKSVLITGITPQYTILNGMNEFYFSKNIYTIFSLKNTCIIGYNNIYFDDEFTRNIFYRNFFDPYSWHWKSNNSRWDLLHVIRACYVLRPQGITWPKDNYGFPTFKLYELTRANNIFHNSIHNAKSDVYATIELAKLIKKKQPRLFNFLFFYRLKNRIRMLIDTSNYIPLIYISSIFGNIRNNMSCIFPIGWNLSNLNVLIFFDLYMDINLLILYLKNKKNNEHFTIQELNSLGINCLYINRCPILVPINSLSRIQFLNLGINLNSYLFKIYILKKNFLLFEKILLFFKKYVYRNSFNNVDLNIYSSFFSDHDKNIMSVIHRNSGNHIQDINPDFSDLKLHEMFFRYRARNFPDSLNGIERKRWLFYRLCKYNNVFLRKYLLDLKKLIIKYSDNLRYVKLLFNLLEYFNNFLFWKL